MAQVQTQPMQQPVNVAKPSMNSAKPAAMQTNTAMPVGESVFKKWWFWLIIAVIILGAAGAAYYFLLTRTI